MIVKIAKMLESGLEALCTYSLPVNICAASMPNTVRCDGPDPTGQLPASLEEMMLQQKCSRIINHCGMTRPH